MEPAEFDAFYAASFPRVMRQVYAMCGDLAEAQDCVQEAFIRAWDQRRHFAEVQYPEAWIRTVAWRLAINRWHRAKRALRPPDRSRPQKSVEEPNPDRVALVAALQQIPTEQRRAIVLHHVCDLSVEQVATETEAPVGTVKARLSRGRNALRVLLDDDSERDDHGPRTAKDDTILVDRELS